MAAKRLFGDALYCRSLHFSLFTSYSGPWPIQEVVPMAVSAAVNAATAMRIITSQILFFSFIVDKIFKVEKF